MNTVNIGNIEIGDGKSPVFMAELGICHGGDVNIALKLTNSAAEAGVQIVKTETFSPDIVYDENAIVQYKIKEKVYKISLKEHMKKYALTFEEHKMIKKECDRLGIFFVATAHDFAAVDFLIDIGAAAVKIASPDIVHIPLLRYVAKKNIPVILDTGSSYMFEIEIAVKIMQDEGLESIIINHNPAGHPAPPDKHDLRMIPRLKEILDLPVGISDHYEGYEMLYAATAIGANILEKPISEDRFVPEPERNWSISIEDLEMVIKNISYIYKALGSPYRKLTKEQELYRNNNRMACIAVRDLRKGEEINLINITFGRPRKGIGVEYWDLIKGRKLRKNKKKYEFLQWEDLD